MCWKAGGRSLAVVRRTCCATTEYVAPTWAWSGRRRWAFAHFWRHARAERGSRRAAHARRLRDDRRLAVTRPRSVPLVDRRYPRAFRRGSPPERRPLLVRRTARGRGSDQELAAH